MEFEFGSSKGEANLRKHGIDFVAAQALWDNTYLEAPLNHPLEERWLVIGTIDDKHWTGVVTYREGRVRIISVRRGRTEERQEYDQGHHS